MAHTGMFARGLGTFEDKGLFGRGMGLSEDAETPDPDEIEGGFIGRRRRRWRYRLRIVVPFALMLIL